MRLIICARNTPNPDPYVDNQRYRVGEVITVLPDGKFPGRAVVSGPLFKIVDVPDLPRAEALALLASEPGYGRPDAMKLDRMLRRRMFRLDPAVLRNYISTLADTTKIDTTIADAIRASKAERPKDPDPNVLG